MTDYCSNCLSGFNRSQEHSWRRNLVLFLVDSCIPARQWTDICNTRCSMLSRFSHFHVSHFQRPHCIPVSSADTRRHLRSANRHLGPLHVLAVPRFLLNTYGRRAFSVAGPMAWNSLPDFIRDPTSSTDCFRRLLKTYLFARY